MEVEVDHLLQAPGEPVRDRDHPALADTKPLAAARPTANTDAETSAACATSSVAGEGKTRKNGARAATAAEK